MTQGHDFGPAFTNGLPQEPAVIPALLGLLGQIRRASEIEKSEIVRRLPFPTNDREIENWEWGQSAPPAGRLDVIVQTYAAATGTVTAALWGEAITRAITHYAVAGIEPQLLDL